MSKIQQYEINLEEVRNKALEQAGRVHTWRQQGVHIVCKSCPYEHGFNVGPFQRLVGISKDGKPVLERSSLFTHQEQPEKIEEITSIDPERSTPRSEVS